MDNFHFEYDESLELTNPSFENGDEGWSFVYYGDSADDVDYKIVSDYEGMVFPTDGINMMQIDTRIDNELQCGIDQKVYIPDNAKYIYFDYNVFETFNADRVYNMSVEGPGNMIYVGIKYETDANFYCAWMDGRSWYDRNSAQLSGISINGNANVVTTGWKTAQIDVSGYAGTTIRMSIMIDNNRYVDVDKTRLFVDNVRFAYTDNQSDYSEPEYEEVSEENSSDAIRGKCIEFYGVSSVFYIKDFEDPDLQASYARRRLMYKYGYSTIEQVGGYCIETEEDFYNNWKDMPENPSTGMIDEVVIIMHGTYYALMIDDGNRQNLTVSPDGRVSSDDDALKISDLPRRNIKTIRINGCNTGLLNAINVDFKAEDEDGIEYEIKGNVAQAFLNGQNVQEVYAWDGNMNPGGKFFDDRLSYTQNGFHNAIARNEILDVNQVIDIDRGYWIDGVDGHPVRIANRPMGLVHYVNDNGKQYCTYEYSYGVLVVTGFVDIDNSQNTRLVYKRV